MSKVKLTVILLLALILNSNNISPQQIYQNKNLKSSKPYSPNRLVVKFKINIEDKTRKRKKSFRVSKKEFDSLKQKLQLPVRTKNKIKDITRLNLRSGNFPSLDNIRVITFEPPVNIEETRKILLKQKEVERVEFDWKIELHSTPNDPLFNKMWNLNNQGISYPLNTRPALKGADIDYLKAIENGGEGKEEVIVAVLDTGVDYNHPDLKNNMWINQAELKGQTGVDDDENGCIDDIHGCGFFRHSEANENVGIGECWDYRGHGTHVSGTIAGTTNNGIGISGICPKCKIMSVRIFPGGSIFAIQGITYAVDNGAKILNNSWGVGTTGQRYWLEKAIKDAYDTGTLIIWCAGNRNENLDQTYRSPVSMIKGKEKIIVVGATNSEDKRADRPTWGSNYGSTVDVSAPGVNIVSTRYVGGDYMTVAINENGISDPNEKYCVISGTSMAAPHVSGFAGWLWSKYPHWTNERITNKIKKSVDNIDNNHSSEFKGLLGTGRINMYSAIDTTNVKHLEITNYPNPFGEDTTIVIKVIENSTFNVSILNINGQVVNKINNISRNTGDEYSFKWGEGVSPGIYIIQVTDKTSKEVHPIIKAE